MITISPGHWLPSTGAKDIIDEVTEARKVAKRVVAILREGGVQANYVEDNVSKNQQQNLTYLVNEHKKTSRKLDVSVHFNASAGRQDRAIGTEVLYKVGALKALASKLSGVMANAMDVPNRGAKYRDNLYFLNSLPQSILLEVCFVNSIADVVGYNENFESLCQSIATTLAEHVGIKLNKKEVRTMEFSSPALKNETETTLASAARRK
ncbi:N-acetylmuramoyl-L-alanine amidase, partial [Metasolibacillus meyeri]|uniref:N-acetylmuramoyl-L-alanine amidase n=1 Tax=Metasolibacillus meyeri TaxID=1071052 RepID=UPI000D301459